MKKNLKEIEHYTKQCYTKEVQQYSSLAIYTIRSTIRRYCSKRMSKFMADLMSVAPCGNRYVQPNDVCVRNFIEKTAPLVYIDDDKKKIPHICWYDPFFSNFSSTISFDDFFLPIFIQ